MHSLSHTYPKAYALWNGISFGITIGVVFSTILSEPLFVCIPILLASFILLYGFFAPTISSQNIPSPPNNMLWVLQTALCLYLSAYSPLIQPLLAQAPFRFPLLLILCGITLTQGLIDKALQSFGLSPVLGHATCQHILKWGLFFSFTTPVFILNHTHLFAHLCIFASSVGFAETTLWFTGAKLWKLLFPISPKQQDTKVNDQLQTETRTTPYSSGTFPQPPSSTLPSREHPENATSTQLYPPPPELCGVSARFQKIPLILRG